MQPFPVRPSGFPDVFGSHPVFKSMLRYENDDSYGILAGVSSIVAATVENEDRFLSRDEWKRWKTIAAQTYREPWFAGRICVAILWARYLNTVDAVPWKELETISRDRNERGTRPRLYHRGVAIDRDLSISHSSEWVLVLVAKRLGLRLGCDLTAVNSVPESVCRRFFHESEILHDNATAPEHREQVWAVKETAYKICNETRGFSPLHWLTRRLDNDTFSCVDLKSDMKNPVTVSTFRHANHVVAVGGTGTTGASPK